VFARRPAVWLLRHNTCAEDLEGPTDGRHAIHQVGEAGSALDGVGIEPCPVVLDAEADVVGRLSEADRGGGPWACVLGSVLEALCPRRGRRSQQLIALGFGEASRRRIAVAQAERGFVQDGGDLVAPLLG